MFNDCDREKLKSIQLDLLKHFIEICEKHKLRYYALGGTALGAIRHGGYIPWDDDIDVGLFRKDYETFLKVAQFELPEYCFLQTHLTDYDYRLPFAKIRNSNTTFREKAVAHLNINHGVYIDIFPIDGFPDSKRLQRKLINYKRLCRVYAEKDYQKDRNFKRKLFTILTRVKFIGKSSSEALSLLDKKVTKYDAEKCNLTVLYGATKLKSDVFDKNVYGKGQIVKFETMQIVIPEQYDLYLSQKYGDYMKLPAVEEQTTDHQCSEIVL